MLYNWIYQKIGLVKLLSEFNPDGEAIFFAIGAVLCCVVSYLFGSLNFAIIVSKKKYNDDIRNYGSGNAGMTNMHRVYGAKGALYTLAGDVGKQIASVFFSALLLGEPGAYLGGLFCILGHIAPVFYKFKGGKGVLAAATMILLLNPVVFLILFVIFVGVVFFSRYISLGSMIAGFSYPGVLAIITQFDTGRPIDFFKMLFAFVIGALIIFTHRTNIERIYKGTENKFSFKKKPVQKISDNGDDDDDDDDDENDD